MKDEESGIADVLQKKELELEKEEELVQLSKVFVPPDKGKVESEKIEINHQKMRRKHGCNVIGLIGKILLEKFVQQC